MTLQNISILNGMSAKMGYLNKRQELLSQNIANADTPNYRPKDLKDVDFARLMGRGGSSKKIKMLVTHSGHLPNAQGSINASAIKQSDVYEVAPDNNGVVIEEQLFKASANSMEYQTMTNLYRRNLGMLRTVINGK